MTAESTVAIPVIFDCVERKFIWCDLNLAMPCSNRGGNNIESNISGVIATCFAMANMNKANLYDLILLNAKARGNIVTDRNEADIIFSNDTTKPTETVIEVDTEKGIETPVTKEKDVKIVTTFDTDFFMGELL